MTLKRPWIFKFLTQGAQLCFLAVMVILTSILTMISIMEKGWLYEEKLFPHKSIQKVCTSANFVATLIPFLLPCIYLAVTLVIAYKMRLFPHNFKETTTIFTTCLIIVMICLMFLSGYSISEPSMRSMLRAIVYWCISQCFLLCLFLPKVIILWKKDDLIDAEGSLSRAIQSYCEIEEKRKSIKEKEEEEKIASARDSLREKKNSNFSSS